MTPENPIAKMEPQPMERARPQSVITRIAERYQVDPDKMLATLKATVFKPQKVGERMYEATNEELMTLLVVADQYQLNPFTKEIYAFPDTKRGGIVPVVGVDGWIRIINAHPAFNGIEFEQDDERCTAIIYRKDRDHAIKVTEYLSECRRDSAAWKSHPKRSLRHKALIQCGRIAFGFSRIYDPDEAEGIRDSGNIIDVTPDRNSGADALNDELGLRGKPDSPPGKEKGKMTAQGGVGVSAED